MLSHGRRIPPLEIAVTSCRVTFLGETRSSIHSLQMVLMADQRINATQIESVCDRKVSASPASHHEKAHKSSSLELPAQLAGNSSRVYCSPGIVCCLYNFTYGLPSLLTVFDILEPSWSPVKSLVFMSFKSFPLPAGRECFSSKQVACNLFFSRKETDLPYTVMVHLYHNVSFYLKTGHLVDSCF